MLSKEKNPVTKQCELMPKTCLIKLPVENFLFMLNTRTNLPILYTAVSRFLFDDGQEEKEFARCLCL